MPVEFLYLIASAFHTSLANAFREALDKATSRAFAPSFFTHTSSMLSITLPDECLTEILSFVLALQLDRLQPTHQPPIQGCCGSKWIGSCAAGERRLSLSFKNSSR